MKTPTLLNYAAGPLVRRGAARSPRCRARVTGETIALTGSQGLDFRAMLDHARRVGGPALGG